MKKEVKIIGGISLCGVVVGGLFLLKKLNDRITRIQAAVYDIVDVVEGIGYELHDNHEIIEEMCNHTDDIASCSIDIKDVMHKFEDTFIAPQQKKAAAWNKAHGEVKVEIRGKDGKRIN